MNETDHINKDPELSCFPQQTEMGGCHIDLCDTCLARLVHIQVRTSVSRFGARAPCRTARLCALEKENVDRRKYGREVGSTCIYASLTPEREGSYRASRQVSFHDDSSQCAL
jgi:hypothetical protein